MIPFSKLDTPSFCWIPIYSKFDHSATFNLWNIYSIFQKLLLQATEPIPARVSVLQSLSIFLAVFYRVAREYKMQVKAALQLQCWRECSRWNEVPLFGQTAYTICTCPWCVCVEWQWSLSEQGEGEPEWHPRSDMGCSVTSHQLWR